MTVIRSTYTIVNPFTMMIESINTPPTFFTMLRRYMGMGLAMMTELIIFWILFDSLYDL